jgi:hypothetical protein
MLGLNREAEKMYSRDFTRRASSAEFTYVTLNLAIGACIC